MSIQLKHSDSKIKAVDKLRERYNHILDIVKESEILNLDIFSVRKYKGRIILHWSKDFGVFLSQEERKIIIDHRLFSPYSHGNPETFNTRLCVLPKSSRNIDDWWGSPYHSIDEEVINSNKKFKEYILKQIIEKLESDFEKIIKVIIDPPITFDSIFEFCISLEKRSLNIKEVITVLEENLFDLLDKLEDVNYNKSLAKQHLENCILCPNLWGSGLFLYQNRQTGKLLYLPDISGLPLEFRAKFDIQLLTLEKVSKKVVQPFRRDSDIYDKVEHYISTVRLGEEHLISKHFKDNLILDIAKAFSEYASKDLTYQLIDTFWELNNARLISQA